VLVVTARSGVKDEANAVVNQYLPGLLTELCGVQVEEYDSLPADAQNALEFAIPELASAPAVSASAWCDVLNPTTARVVAHYTQDYYAGKPAITVNEVEQGQVVYVGTFGDADIYQALSGWLLALADVRPLLATPEGVEATERWQGDRRLLFLLNHTDQEQTISLDGRLTNILEEAAVEGEITIAAKDVLILTEA
jgi:beta-galactosidase